MTAGQHDAAAPHGDYLTADEILGFRDIAERDVDIPEWGGRKVHLRAFTVGEIEQITVEAAKVGPGAAPGEIDRTLLNALYFVHAVVDPVTKKPLFRLAHVHALKAKSAVAVGRVVTEILRMNGLLPEVAKEAEARFQDGLGGVAEVHDGAEVGHDGAPSGGGDAVA